jgi:hypothetical protein
MPRQTGGSGARDLGGSLYSPSQASGPEGERQRAVDKIAKKTEKWAKNHEDWGWIFRPSADFVRADFSERALRAAREAAYQVYADTNHYPAGPTVSPAAQEADRQVYGQARRAARGAYEIALEDEEAYSDAAYEVEVAEYYAVQEDPWSDKDIECWCASNFIANDMGLSKEALRRTCEKHKDR